MNKYLVNDTSQIIENIKFIQQDQGYIIPYDQSFIFLFQSYKIKHKRENEVIYFECDSIQTLNEFIDNNGKNKKLKYNDIVKLIYDTGILIKNLEEDKRGIFCFSLHDFIVINNNLFLFINPFKLSNIYKNNLTLKIPIDITENFINNDTNFSHLPITSNYKNSYYNFGLMIFYLLTGKIYSKEKINLLDEIYQTSLYFFILRCLNDNPKERYYIYI